MKQVTINTYQFDELSDEAKEVAMGWWREGIESSDWSEPVIADAATVGLKITGFDTDRYCEGEFTEDALFTASKIVVEHGEECETYKTALEFLGKRDEIVNSAAKDENGDFEDEAELDVKLDDVEEEFLKSILEDYRIMLRKELEYQHSDENVAECIRINEYEFTEDGKRFVVKREAVNA